MVGRQGAPRDTCLEGSSAVHPGWGGGRGEAVSLRVLFTLNYSGKQTHYLGTRIKSYSLYFN